MNSQSDTSNKSVFLSPRSIAIIGASEKPGIGRAIFTNIKNGYKGKIYPVSPTNEYVSGIKAYKSVLDIPEDIDLAVVATPNKIVPKVMEEVGMKKFRVPLLFQQDSKKLMNKVQPLKGRLLPYVRNMVLESSVQIVWA